MKEDLHIQGWRVQFISGVNFLSSRTVTLLARKDGLGITTVADNEEAALNRLRDLLKMRAA